MPLTPEDFAVNLLGRLGIRPNRGNVKALVGWQAAEGGHTNGARYNPLNTTQPAPGAGNTGTQGNIKVYRDWKQGLGATVQTLENGRYTPILRALKGNDPQAVARAIGQTPWGTSGDLVSRTIAGTKVGNFREARTINGGGGRDGGGGAGGGGLRRVSVSAVGQGQATTNIDTGGDTGALAALAQSLTARQAPPMQAPLPVPAFAARPVLPAGYQAPQAQASPAQKVDLSAQLSALAVTSHESTMPVTARAQGKASLSGVVAGPSVDDVAVSGAGPVGGKLVREATRRANVLESRQLNYLYGGGHGQKRINVKATGPLDCSSAVSAVLGVDVRVSGAFESFGKPGRAPGGKGITIYANPEHVLMEINGRFFGTSRSNPGGGAGWIPRSVVSGGYLRNFTARHVG